LPPSTIAQNLGCSTRTIQRIQRRLYGIDETSTTVEVDRYEDLAEAIGRGADDKRRVKRGHRRTSAGAGVAWGWIGAIAVIGCGVGGVALARRWRVSLPIGAGAADYATSLGGLSTQASRAFKTVAPHRATSEIYAPLPELFDPSPWDDAGTVDRDRPPRSNAYGRFVAFPGAFDFAPDSDAG
jgi:hypothetical protein